EPEPEPIVNPFSDVSEGSWYYKPVMWAVEKGMVSGSRFNPSKDCTRAQTLTFLWRAKGCPEPSLKVSPFKDVKSGDYYFEPVLWAFENGMISVSGDAKFKPDDTVSRAQLMTFLYRAENGDADGLDNPFSNVKSSDWYYEPAVWAYSRGIISLDSGGKFSASSSCTRAQVMTFLWRTYSGDPSAMLNN
ncbi:MAG: S-layer homology domain-containing protein, partial [Oscillospiraceae bacterium]|nr:S-layer homology domain-containing protein [Oscillospiraceae bacterium]